MNRGRPWLVPASLFLVALLVRLVAIAWVPFPPTEGSLYYLDVARNLVQGHGLTTDVLWSYANPPLTLPRPAFDLWLPLASVVAAVPMLIGGTAHQMGQLGGVLLGASLAPLTWAVTREATVLDGLDARRSGAAAVTAGLLAAVLGPFLVATVAPDSTVPFAVLGTVDALLVSHLLRGSNADGRRPWLRGIVLGICLGLTYLARQEVIWIGLTLVILAVPTIRSVAPGGRARHTLRLLGPVVAGGLLLVVPWLVRQQLTFGGGATAQALENMFLLRNEQIFAVHDRPTLRSLAGPGRRGHRHRTRTRGRDPAHRYPAGGRLSRRPRGHAVRRRAATTTVPAAAHSAGRAAPGWRHHVPGRCPAVPRGDPLGHIRP